MSLVLDSLKKVSGSSGKGKAVPPSLLNLKPSGGRGQGPRKSLLVLLVLALVGFAAIMFMPSGGNYKVNAAAGAIPAAQPIPEEPEKTAAEPVIKKPVQQPVPLYDPTAANIQRLANLRSLPEINKPAPVQEAAPAPTQQQKPEAAAPVQSTQPVQPEPAKPAVQSSPYFALSGRAKKEYDERSEYNTTVAQAADALRAGNNARAEEFYSKALAVKPSRPLLTGLITSKIRQGKSGEVQPLLNSYPETADASVVSAAAMEMHSVGHYAQALTLLSANSRRNGNEQIYYTAGIIQENAGDYPKAEEAYRKAVQAAPNDGYILYAYARILDVEKKYTDALGTYDKIATVSAADDTVKSSAKNRAAAIRNYLNSLN